MTFLKTRVDSIQLVIVTEEKRVQDSIDKFKKDSLGLDIKKKDTILPKGELIDPRTTQEI
jgi:hypothetical protein